MKGGWRLLACASAREPSPESGGRCRRFAVGREDRGGRSARTPDHGKRTRDHALGATLSRCGRIRNDFHRYRRRKRAHDQALYERRHVVGADHLGVGLQRLTQAPSRGCRPNGPIQELDLDSPEQVNADDGHCRGLPAMTSRHATDGSGGLGQWLPIPRGSVLVAPTDSHNTLRRQSDRPDLMRACSCAEWCSSRARATAAQSRRLRAAVAVTSLPRASPSCRWAATGTCRASWGSTTTSGLPASTMWGRSGTSCAHWDATTAGNSSALGSTPACATLRTS